MCSTSVTAAVICSCTRSSSRCLIFVSVHVWMIFFNRKPINIQGCEGTNHLGRPCYILLFLRSILHTVSYTKFYFFSLIYILNCKHDMVSKFQNRIPCGFQIKMCWYWNFICMDFFLIFILNVLLDTVIKFQKRITCSYQIYCY